MAESGSVFDDREFRGRVLRAAAVATEPFLISDLIVSGLTLTPAQRTAAFHVIRDAMDRGEFEHRGDGYWRSGE